ncbi:hypothetical protein BH10ACI1_BH10ACI1_06290 [soil metagenome]
MQKIGIESAFLLVASMLSFLFGAFVPEWARVGMGFSILFFVAACVLLAVTIFKRSKTKVG